jgi:hypothetical protein
MSQLMPDIDKARIVCCVDCKHHIDNFSRHYPPLSPGGNHLCRAKFHGRGPVNGFKYYRYCDNEGDCKDYKEKRRWWRLWL